MQVGKSAQSFPRVSVCLVFCGEAGSVPKDAQGPQLLHHKSPRFVSRQLTDNELEAGRNLNVQLRSELGYRDAVLTISGASMISSGSGSGNTVFYDAQSREDLASTPSPITTLPQGMSSTSRSGV